MIPNKSRAEEIATQQFNAAKKEQSVSENNKSSFFKRRKAQNHRRSKSLGKVRRNVLFSLIYLHVNTSQTDLPCNLNILNISWPIFLGNH